MADRNGYIGRAPSDSAVTVARQSYSVSGVTTDFTFTSGYVPGYFDVFVNGVKMIEGSDYTSSDGSTFSILNGGAINGDVVEAIGYKAFNVATIDSAPGNFSVGGELSFGSVAAGSSVSFATTSFNLSGTPDITVNDVSANDITANNFTGVAGTFSGFVAFSTSISVGGTITYEDVENIDSVGLITARQGVEFGVSGVGGTISASGDATFAGIVTASDGTLIAGVGINSDGTNIGYGITTLNFVGTGNTFAVRPGNTMEISIQGGGGGGGAELDITASLFT